LRALIAIAQATGEPEVDFFFAPACGAWDEMLDFEFAQHEALWAETIPATVLGSLAHALSKCL
jgi:hypothetical protein